MFLRKRVAINHRSKQDGVEVASNTFLPSRVKIMAVGSQAVGAFAIGALAIGSIAIGALAIGRLAVGRARMHHVEIDELVVHRLRVTEMLQTPTKPEADD